MAKPGAKLTLEGVVDAHGGGGLFEIGPRIGDVAVADAVSHRLGFGAKDVKVILMVEAEQHLDADGKLSAYPGFGGTEVTPYEPPEVNIGDIRLLGRLQELDGRTVALSIEVVA